MLWFLSLAAKRNYTIKRYEDTAYGIMEKNSKGKLAITKVILRPFVAFISPDQLNQQVIEKLHNQAHQQCFFANSVKSEIIIDGQFEVAHSKN